jgi:hypothetical protein
MIKSFRFNPCQLLQPSAQICDCCYIKHALGCQKINSKKYNFCYIRLNSSRTTHSSLKDELNIRRKENIHSSETQNIVIQSKPCTDEPI